MKTLPLVSYCVNSFQGHATKNVGNNRSRKTELALRFSQLVVSKMFFGISLVGPANCVPILIEKGKRAFEASVKK